MALEPRKDPQAALEERIGRALDGTAQFTAPPDLHTQVWDAIERRAQVPWWQRRVPEWPAFAQIGFAATGVAAAAAIVLGRPASSVRLDAVIQRPVADLHATLGLFGLIRRFTDSLAGSVPDSIWYAGVALCAMAYVALFFTIIFGYRLLQAPQASR